MKRPEDIRQIIEDEIAKKSSIGFIKDNLLFMNVERNPKCFIFIILSIIVFFLLILLLVNVEGNIFIFMIFQASAIVFLIAALLYIFCKNYLIYDINKSCFYTISNLFGKFTISFLTTSKIDAIKIEQIILNTQRIKSKHSNSLYDKVIVIINNNKTDLIDLMSYKNHITLVAICNMFSKCFDVKYKTSD